MQEIILTFVPIISRTDDWISLSVILLMWPFRHFLSQIWSGWLPILYRMERNPLCRRTLHHVGVYGSRPQSIEHAVGSLTWNVFSAHKEANGWRLSVVRRRKEKSFDKARPIASHSSARVRTIAAILTEHRVKVRLRPNANGVFWESDGRDWHKLRFAWDGPEVRIGPSGAVDVGLFYSVTDFLASSRSAAASFLMTRKSLSFGYSVLGWEVLVLRKSSWT